MKTKVDLENAEIKKDAPKVMAVELLDIYPKTYEKDGKDEKVVEKGSLKINLPDLGIQIRNILYKITEDKRVKFFLPSFSYPNLDQSKNKQEKLWVQSISFNDRSGWKIVSSEIKRLAIENYNQRQAEKPKENDS